MTGQELIDAVDETDLQQTVYVVVESPSGIIGYLQVKEVVDEEGDILIKLGDHEW